MLELPAIRTVPIEPNEELMSCFNSWREEGYDWIVFTSPTGVRVFFDAFLKNMDMRDMAGVNIASIGKGTERALRDRGLKSDFIPSV